MEQISSFPMIPSRTLQPAQINLGRSLMEMKGKALLRQMMCKFLIIIVI